MNGATVSVEADGERREDRSPVPIGAAVQRFFDMLETGLHRYPAAGEQRELRRMSGKALQRGQTIDRGHLADRIHPRMEIERGKPEAALADLGNAQPHFASHL